jgi:cytosine/adenosine deaminase-related metal-dependent hydrolase
VAAWVGFAELALGGCTTTSDHHYLHPRGAGDLITAEIEAAVDIGMRFTATRGSMSLSKKDGGLPPDSVVQDDDEILADSERLVGVHHDRSKHAMVQLALAPCSRSPSPELMTRRRARERLDVRLHTHLAEDLDEIPSARTLRVQADPVLRRRRLGSPHGSPAVHEQAGIDKLAMGRRRRALSSPT